MISLDQGSADQRPQLDGGVLGAIRHKFGNRTVLLLLAGIAFASGLAVNWSWVEAVGVAPLLLTALPCVAMCAGSLHEAWSRVRPQRHRCFTDYAEQPTRSRN